MRRFILGAGIDPPGKKPARYVPRVDVYAEPSGHRDRPVRHRDRLFRHRDQPIRKRPGIGHDQPDSPVTIRRIARSRSTGLPGHVAPEYALYESGGLSDGMVECFVLYLAGHNRPPHEVLFGNDKDIAAEYERAFVGMTEVACSLDTLLAARAQMRQELPRRLTAGHKQFLSGLVRAEPDWSVVQCPHAAELPALRWKLANLEAFRKRRPADFAAQVNALDEGLGRA